MVPATPIKHDRATGERKRHHLHGTVLQRAVKDAVPPDQSGPARRRTEPGEPDLHS